MTKNIKKFKTLISFIALSSLVALPFATISCIIPNHDEPNPKPPEPSKPNIEPEPSKPNINPEPSKPNIEPEPSNPSENDEDIINNDEIKEFTYDGMLFKIAKEDTFDKNKKYYANMVLENDAQEFKKFLNNYGDYWINNLNEYDFPTLVNVSRYIRSLDFTKNGFITYSKDDNRPITAQEYNILVTKLLKILDVKDTFDLSDAKNKDKKISHLLNHNSAFDNLKSFYISNSKSYLNIHWDDWLKVLGDNNTFGRKVILYDGIYYDEISAKDSDAPETNINGKTYKVPSVSWKLKRDIYLNNMFNNEMFLSYAFYEKTLSKDQTLNNDWIDGLYLNDSSNLSMQVVQYKLLVSYLRLMKKLTDSINFDIDAEDKDKAIKENGSIVDSSKSLEENLINTNIFELIDQYEKALLDYLALEHLMGFTAREDHNTNLQLFPGGENYEYKVDYRDTYKWAKRQYEEFILPFKLGLGSPKEISVIENTYKNIFNNPETIKKYELIWANIKAVDKIDKPKLLSKDEATGKLADITYSFIRFFKWKMKP